MAQLQHYVHILAILKEMLKLHHILVPDAPVDLNLTHQLLLSSRFDY
jgi:hypothetical protein